MNALAQEVARTFGSPAIMIDLDRVEQNIARLQTICDRAGIANRPHIKTHKSPLIAGLQRQAGAVGITCQKLGEAEVMADAGFDDILIAYNIMGDEKLARLAALMRRVKLSVTADHPFTVEGLSKAARAAERPLNVLVECDTGRKRAGVETAGEAVELARRVAASPGLSFGGLMFYPPETAMVETQAFLDEAVAGLRAHGLESATISSGGTPNIANMGRLAGVTEHRAGTYVFNDRMTLKSGAAGLDDIALVVVSTVVSRGGQDRGILDAGSKTLTSDTGGLEGHGFILEHPKARISKFAEEHGFLDLSACNDRPAVGDVVRIIPNHVCVVVNMMDRLIATRGGEIVGEIPVAARGRIS
jgi:D-serine deaminase-like pyridoxal phosphate-dependent protein